MGGRVVATRGPNLKPRQRVPDFERRLRELIKARGLKGMDLATLLGVSDSTISVWLIGRAKPNLDMLVHLCRVLEVDPNWLLGWPSKAGGNMGLARAVVALEGAVGDLRRELRGDPLRAVQRFAADYPEAVGPRRERHGNKKVRATS